MFDLDDPWGDAGRILVPEPCRIYVAENIDIFAIVDEEDYAWAVRWRWSLKWSRGFTKAYMRRVAQETLQKGTATERFRIQRTVWLHRAIVIERMKIEPPSPQHTMIDHDDGDELNCRRSNLRWATPKENRANRKANSAAVRRSLGL